VVKVYAVALVIGVIGLIVLIMGAALAENLGRADLDPAGRLGPRARPVVAAALGFGMGGMSAEFAPIDISWPLGLLLAILAAVVSVGWVRYAVGRSGAR
jgi:hypothetical protein